MPNLSKSSGIASAKMSVLTTSSIVCNFALNPTPALPLRLSMIFSRPEKAPPTINSMFVVSICKNSWCGCLRPPCGGTDAVVPSNIFSNACCTPSPDTSLVIDGFSAFLATLSISSI
ncbi:unannotated protein [freshwater metagenome]|uniref:Unannotated protein n=1 Tax=freshwater metagenome TaxID=449393 RepID=A0A6J7KE49_9ZZZZ